MSRILMLAQFYPPIIGGEERHVRNLGQALAARGHEVAVATLRHGGAAEAEWDGAVRVHRIAATAQRAAGLFSDPGHAHAPPLPDPEAVLGLGRIVGTFRPDVVHAHNWIVHAFLPLKRREGPRLLLTLHDYSLACPVKTLMRQGSPCPGPALGRCLACAGRHYGAAKGAATTLANRLMAPLEARAVDRFIAVSGAVADGNGLRARGLPHEVIPNFVPDGIAALGPADDPRLAELPEGPFILFVGDVRRLKGAHALLEAYASLGPPLPLVMIGRRCADAPAALPRGARILESWPHHLVMHAWSRAAVGVAPSLWPEPCATVVMEGMAMGKPMVVAATGGMTDMVRDGAEGLLVPPGDAGALAAALGRLLGDPALAARMGAAARRRVAAFSSGAVVPRIEAAYAAALAGAPACAQGQAA